jgi:hypothetical protein
MNNIIGTNTIINYFMLILLVFKLNAYHIAYTHGVITNHNINYYKDALNVYFL